MMRSRPQLSWSNPWVMMVVIAACYVATARLGLALAMPPDKKATAVWPPSGIALAGVLLAGYRVWPGIWLGAFCANLWDFFDPANSFSLGAHVGVSSGIAVSSTLQALLGGCLIRRWIGPGRVLESAWNVLRFVAISLLVCLVASTLGVTTLVLGQFTDWSQWRIDWYTWWLGDTVGILLVTPLVLTWSQGLPRLERRPWRWAEAGVLLALQLGVGAVAFGGWNGWSRAYVSVPLLVWATFRFARRGATASLALLSAIAVVGTVLGRGPFYQATLGESLLSLQAFMGILAVTALVLAGVLEERRVAEEAKAKLIDQLEQALHEIRTLRGLIPICAWCKKIRNDAGAWQQLEAYLRDHTEAEFSHGICPDCFAERAGDDARAGRS